MRPNSNIFPFLALCALVMNLGVSAQNNTASFKSAIPHLQLLESGFPNVKDVDPREYSRYDRDIANATHKFVGIVVTSDMIKEKLGALKPQSRYLDAPIPPAVKKLIVYCDSFALSDSLWFPQCNYEIHARIVNMNGKSIVSSPVPWRKAIDMGALQPAGTDTGRAGLTGGNISVVCDKVLHPGKLVANGSAGEWTYIPQVSVDAPKVARHIECYKNMGCSNQGSGRSQGIDAGRSWQYEMVASVFHNEDYILFKEVEKCTGYISWDDKGGVEFSRKDGDNSVIVDRKADRRIVAKVLKPGKGGNGGNISIVYGSNPGPIAESAAGKTGYFKARNKDGKISYSSQGDRCTRVNIEHTTYMCFKVTVSSNVVGDISVGGGWSSKPGHNYLEIPNWNDVNIFNSKLSLDAPNKDGDPGAKNVRQGAYIPHPEYFVLRTRYLQQQYSVYHKKTPAQQKALDAEMNDVVKQLEKIVQATGDVPGKGDYVTAWNKAIALSQTSIKNLDEYNNEPGYRPLLSIQSTLSYIKNNLESDIRLFVLSDIMAGSEQKAGAFRAKIPGMIDDLYTSNRSLSDKLVEKNKKYTDLAAKAAQCELKTDTIKKKLKELEEKMREQAKGDQQRMAILKAGIKTCALVASVIPYGQPALGQIAGNGLNALADNISEAPEDIAVSVMDKIDLKGAMKKLAERKLKGTAPDKLPNQTEIDVSNMENVSVDILRYNREIQEKKYEKESKKYESQLDKTKETYTKAASGAKDILTSYAKTSADKDEIEKRISDLANTSLLFKDIQGDLKQQMDLKEEIFDELNALVQEGYDINDKIIQNSDCIAKLQRMYMGGLPYNKELEDVLKDIREASLARLKWIEYQLVKVYEYTTLTPYKQKMPSAEMLEELYARKKDTLTATGLERVVKDLAIVYAGQQTIMGNQILFNISSSHKQDAKHDPENLGKYGRKVLLTTGVDNTQATLLDDLNRDHSVSIDLQKDLVEEIIKPNESEARIIDIALDAIEFDGKKLPENGSVDVILDIEDGGVLRKGDQFYFFQVGDKEHAADRWKWTIRNINGRNTITNASQLSSQYKELIKFMTQTESSASKEDNENIFTLPPAWARCKLRLRYNGGGMSGRNTPKISKLMLSIRCDYVDINNKNKHVLDVKTQNAPAGTQFVTHIGGVAKTHSSNYYDVLQANTEVELGVKELPGDDKKFVRWEVYGSKVPSGHFTEKKIRFKQTDDTRVVAIFGEESKPMGKLSVSPQAMINLYETASVNSKVLAKVRSLNEVQFIRTDIEGGFSRVVYNGIQEAFVKNE